MPSNSLPDADLNLPEMKTKSSSCPSGRVHMYAHSNVIDREIYVKVFSETTAPRILKLGTNVGYGLLYCVRENQHAAAYHSPYLSIFLSLKAKFLLNFLAFMITSLQISFTS